ncbi:uncharacterized protein PAC_10638 [Phialocephala subalpina]|uniref:Uncharacterized protein n=1 Tax=Phialocephala subalpina TaxID=576137 RepID=A0A1L7X6X0_9HELO|nr:uncharacterized protein PAC_10638 [Phialocephala subalpina]
MPQSTRPHRASSGSMVFPNNGQNSRPRVDPKDLCIGCIVWLPPKLEHHSSITCNKENCCGRELDDGGYDHPVVVVKIRQREGSYTRGDVICTVACVTTFGDTSLSTYIDKRPQWRYMQWSIPISEPNPKAAAASIYAPFPMLRLESGTLHKQSYVRTQHTYGVPVSMLRQYNFRIHQAYAKRLCEHSCNLLTTRLGLGTQTYTPTSIVIKTGALHLTDLASTGGRIKNTSTDLRFGTTPRRSPHARRSSLGNESYPLHLLPSRNQQYAYWAEDYDLNVDPLGFGLDFRQTLAVFLLAGLPIWWNEGWDLVLYLAAGLVTWRLLGKNAVVHLAIAPLHWWLLRTFINLSRAVIPQGGWWMLVKIVVILYFVSLLCLLLPVQLLRLLVGHREPKLRFTDN